MRSAPAGLQDMKPAYKRASAWTSSLGKAVLVRLYSCDRSGCRYSASAGDGAHPHWSYSGHTGPSHWGTLEKEYAACASRHAQSPIDIHSSAAKKTDLPAIQFTYKPSPL